MYMRVFYWAQIFSELKAIYIESFVRDGADELINLMRAMNMCQFHIYQNWGLVEQKRVKMHNR